jgi:hypothetical protein
VPSVLGGGDDQQIVEVSIGLGPAPRRDTARRFRFGMPTDPESEALFFIW